MTNYVSNTLTCKGALTMKSYIALKIMKGSTIYQLGLYNEKITFALLATNTSKSLEVKIEL